MACGNKQYLQAPQALRSKTIKLTTMAVTRNKSTIDWAGCGNNRFAMLTSNLLAESDHAMRHAAQTSVGAYGDDP